MKLLYLFKSCSDVRLWAGKEVEFCKGACYQCNGVTLWPSSFHITCVLCARPLGATSPSATWGGTYGDWTEKRSMEFGKVIAF